MTESIITLSLVGLLAGFILSMPLAGPISILITSNALKGRIKYCHRATVGASLADFVFIFIAVFGVTKLYSVYRPFIPYVLLAGAIFLLHVGWKIFKTKIDIEHLPDDALSKKIKKQGKGGFRTGFLISFLNPTLFISWMTSSLLIISFVASLGFNMGGLDKNLDATFKEIKKMDKSGMRLQEKTLIVPNDSISTSISSLATGDEEIKSQKNFPLILSLFYSFFVSAGSIVWFYFLTWILMKYRKRINHHVVSIMIQGLAVVLCVFGVFIGYKGLVILID